MAKASIIESPRFYTAKDVSSTMGISEASAYRMIRKLNKELTDQGKVVVAGKISKRYFDEKSYF